jgi:hypothetical protein
VTKRLQTVYSGFTVMGSKTYRVHPQYTEFVFCIKHTSNKKELILTHKEAQSLLGELQLFIKEGEPSEKY